MYTRYFGLIDPPFSIAPNPRYLYMSDRHREALAHLLYGVKSDGGFVLLTGEVGTGKTTVCRCLIEELPEDVDTAFILNPRLTATELLATICDDLHIEYPPDATLKILVDRLNEFLLRSHAANRRTLLIIDEAQNLSIEVLEQLRLLTNLETNQRKLLQIILLGQPELLAMLEGAELRQLSQRITARFHLDALNRDEVTEYINHRLAVAGAKGELFPELLCRRIYRLSGGVPRLINLICDRALLGTYSQNQLQVQAATVDKAAAEVLGKTPRGSRSVAAAASILLLITLFATTWVLVQGRLAPGASGAEKMAGQEITEPAVTLPADSAVSEQETDSGASDPIPGSGVPALLSSDTGADADVAVASPAERDIGSRIAPPEQDPLDNGALRDLLAKVPQEGAVAAYGDLFRLWGLVYAPEPDRSPCDSARQYGLRCWHRLGSLPDIEHINRPAILELTDAADRTHYVTVASYEGGVVTLVIGAIDYPVREDALAGLWNGRHTLLWRTPPGYTAPSKIGDGGLPVRRLEERLATIHHREARDATTLRFDRQIELEVIRFQMDEGLVPDGVVGSQTWIHLNSRTEHDVPLLRQRAILTSAR